MTGPVLDRLALPVAGGTLRSIHKGGKALQVFLWYRNAGTWFPTIILNACGPERIAPVGLDD
jgi:hypothetical protein